MSLPSLVFSNQLMIIRKLNKQIISLDTQEQLDFLKQRNPSPACDIRNLIAQLTPAQFESYQLDLIKEYRSGLEPIQTDSDPMTADRNLFWLPKILQEVQIGNAFIAVGYAHLYGSKGLIQLLRVNGYKVIRTLK